MKRQRLVTDQNGNTDNNTDKDNNSNAKSKDGLAEKQQQKQQGAVTKIARDLRFNNFIDKLWQQQCQAK